MKAGSLNSRITIKRRVAGQDDIGGPIEEAWEDVASVWANVRHLNGAEAIKADAVVSTVKASIRVRKRDGITAAMRVHHKETVYEIKAVLPDEVERDKMDLVCEVVS